MMLVRITFNVILLFVAISASAESAKEEEYHCPLNASYLLNQLNAMEALPLYPRPEQVAPLQKHATRMTVEELKNKELIPRDSCDYFKISLYLMGLEKGSDEFPKQFAAYNIAELLTASEQCRNWISGHFKEKEAPLESYYCR